MTLVAEPNSIVSPVPARRRVQPNPFSRWQVLSTLSALAALHVAAGDPRSYRMLRHHTVRLWPYVEQGASESQCVTAMGRLIAQAWAAHDAEQERLESEACSQERLEMRPSIEHEARCGAGIDQ